MVTSVIELADALYKKAMYYYSICDNEGEMQARTLSAICANAYDQGIPLSIVEQLLRGTGYEQLLS